MCRWENGKSELEAGIVSSVIDNAGTSGKKFQNFAIDDDNEMNVESASPDYVLVHRDTWGDIFKNFVCTDCGLQEWEIKFNDTKGFASKLVVKCSSCGKCNVDTYTSPRVTYDSS